MWLYETLKMMLTCNLDTLELKKKKKVNSEFRCSAESYREKKKYLFSLILVIGMTIVTDFKIAFSHPFLL